MIRALSVMPAGRWTGAPADTVVLDYDSRHRRRLAMHCEDGLEFLLDLPEAIALRDGDALRLEDGRLVAVKGAGEPLTRVLAKGPEHLVRIAWHLGNRHLPTQVGTDHLFIRRDPVIEDMLRGLGAIVLHVRAPFDPEGGAYAHAAPAAHAHDHDHDHPHDHGDHDHHGHDHPHDDHHGHDHGHDHDHHHHD